MSAKIKLVRSGSSKLYGLRETKLILKNSRKKTKKITAKWDEDSIFFFHFCGKCGSVGDFLICTLLSIDFPRILPCFYRPATTKRQKLWTVRERNCIHTYESFGGPIHAAVFHPSGNYIAAAVHDGSVKVGDFLRLVKIFFIKNKYSRREIVRNFGSRRGGFVERKFRARRPVSAASHAAPWPILPTLKTKNVLSEQHFKIEQRWHVCNGLKTDAFVERPWRTC